MCLSPRTRICYTSTHTVVCVAHTRTHTHTHLYTNTAVNLLTTGLSVNLQCKIGGVIMMGDSKADEPEDLIEPLPGEWLQRETAAAKLLPVGSLGLLTDSFSAHLVAWRQTSLQSAPVMSFKIWFNCLWSYYLPQSVLPAPSNSIKPKSQYNICLRHL